MSKSKWEVIARRTEYGPGTYPETHLYHTEAEANAKADALRCTGEYDPIHVVERNYEPVLKPSPENQFSIDLWAVLEDHPIY